MIRLAAATLAGLLPLVAVPPTATPPSEVTSSETRGTVVAPVADLRLTGVGARTSDLSPRPSSVGRAAGREPTARPTPSCAEVVAAMSLSERVGQVLMVAQSSTSASASGRKMIKDLHVGSVVLLGNSKAGVTATRKLTDGLHAGAGPTHGVRLLVAADQEGGLVQRLQGTGFARIPSATRQAGWSDHNLQQKATTWSEQLRRAGVDANLAPVADVVPASVGSQNEPIGALDRGYGSKPSVVAHKTAAVVRGMHAGGTATTAKHFPGLGRVRGNTDTTTRVVDEVTTRHDGLLAGFTAEVAAGTDLVMVSSATYTRIDAERPAAYSPVVMQEMLRGDLGFTGVIISDDLFARALSSNSAGERAVRFLSAGGDLALVGDPSQLRTVRGGLLARARADQVFRARVTASATRVVELKSRQGLASCSVASR